MKASVRRATSDAPACTAPKWCPRPAQTWRAHGQIRSRMLHARRIDRSLPSPRAGSRVPGDAEKDEPTRRTALLPFGCALGQEFFDRSTVPLLRWTTRDRLVVAHPVGLPRRDRRAAAEAALSGSRKPWIYLIEHRLVGDRTRQSLAGRLPPPFTATNALQMRAGDRLRLPPLNALLQRRRRIDEDQANCFPPIHRRDCRAICDQKLTSTYRTGMTTGDTSPVIVDRRASRAGYILVARHLPVSERPWRLDELPRDRLMVGYCGMRHELGFRNKRAWKLLRRHVYQAQALYGGLSAWRAVDHRIDRGPGRP